MLIFHKLKKYIIRESFNYSYETEPPIYHINRRICPDLIYECGGYSPFESMLLYNQYVVIRGIHGVNTILYVQSKIESHHINYTTSDSWKYFEIDIYKDYIDVGTCLGQYKTYTRLPSKLCKEIKKIFKYIKSYD